MMPSEQAHDLINAEPSYGGQEPFVMTRLCVLFSPELPAPAKCLYSTLVAFAWNRKRTVFPSSQTLERLLGLKRTAVYNNLVILRDAGLISWKRRGMTKSNIYRLEKIPAQFESYLDTIWPVSLDENSSIQTGEYPESDVQKSEHHPGLENGGDVQKSEHHDVQKSEHEVEELKKTNQKSPSETSLAPQRRTYDPVGIGLKTRATSELDRGFGYSKMGRAVSTPDVPDNIAGVPLGSYPRITRNRRNGPRSGTSYEINNPRIAAYQSFIAKRTNGQLDKLTTKELEIHYLLCWEEYRPHTKAMWFPSDPMFNKLVSDQVKRVGMSTMVKYITFCFQNWMQITKSWDKAPTSPSPDVLFKLFRVFYPWFEAGRVPTSNVTDRNYKPTNQSEEDEINALFAGMEEENR